MTRICCLLGAALLVIAMSAVVGCGRPMLPRSTGQAPGTDPLTPDERIAWEKVRRRADSRCLALYHLHADEWGADSNHVTKKLKRRWNARRNWPPNPTFKPP
jgi:hypothetical protein